jgi:predicted aspartyl protease
MRVPFDPQRGLIVIPTRIWGPDGDIVARLALDTGATSTLLNWDLVVLVGYDPAAVASRVQVTTGSGVEFVPQVSLDKIEALGNERTDFGVLCHTLPPSATVDGVLGLDFMRGRRLVVDLRRGWMSLE